MGSFLNIASQCCDALSYIDEGHACAVSGVCYGEIRPIGDYLWFAIPYKLGWPVESLVVMNIALLIVSVLLSVRAFSKLMTLPHSFFMGKCAMFLLLLLSFVTHAFFLLPTMFNTLADPPASLLLLSGIWLLMIAHFKYRSGLLANMQFMLSGLCIGCAVWMRAFYLYPVLLALGLYLATWIFSSKRRLSELLLFAALLPIGSQYIVMYKVYGSYSYLNPEMTSKVSGMHLNSIIVGYDTILPAKGYVWVPQHCVPKSSLLDGLRAKDYGSVICIITARAYFYLGTYSPQAYLSVDVEDPDNIRQWRPMLLLLNVVVLLLAAVAIITNRGYWFKQRAGIYALALTITSAAESIVIIPEQRFAIVWIVFFWLIALTYLLMIYLKFCHKYNLCAKPC